MTVFGEAGMFEGQAGGRWRLSLTSANGQPAFAVYERQGQGDYRPFGIHVLTLDANKLIQIISFIDASLPPRFRAG